MSFQSRLLVFRIGIKGCPLVLSKHRVNRTYDTISPVNKTNLSTPVRTLYTWYYTAAQQEASGK